MQNEFLAGLLAGVVGAGVLGPLLLAVVRAFIGSSAKNREAAQVAADWLAFAAPVVEMVDALDIPGPERFVHAERELVEELDRQGLKGDARRVVEKHIPFLIEFAHKQLRAAQAMTQATPEAPEADTAA